MHLSSEMRLKLPQPDAPLANYVRAVRTGTLLYVAGHAECGENFLTGKAGGGVTMEQAYASARRVGLCLLATVKAEVADLRKVKRIVTLSGRSMRTSGGLEHFVKLSGRSTPTHDLDQTVLLERLPRLPSPTLVSAA